jgi:hypothetical protein
MNSLFGLCAFAKEQSERAQRELPDFLVHAGKLVTIIPTMIRRRNKKL